MIASNIIKPQSYDEFLTQDRLPCPFVGCKWAGRKLSQHVAMVHKIPARELKRLLGFNTSTGLVTPDLREAMRPMAERLSPPRPGGPRRTKGGRASGEAREHRRKMFSRRSEDATCEHCGTEYLRSKGTRRKYCSNRCTWAAQYTKRKQRASPPSNNPGDTLPAAAAGEALHSAERHDGDS